jgi:hypothetical protein
MIDMTGQRVGQLVVLRQHSERKNHQVCWVCQCDCGNTTVVLGGNLRSGVTRSCGCRRAQSARETHTIHGGAPKGAVTREYRAWWGARARCINPHRQDYPYYGGRGITMCDKWLNDFNAFLADMGPCPTEYTLDRKNSNGNYDPDNCRWASRITQSRNRRNVSILPNGVSLPDYADQIGVPRKWLYWHFVVAKKPLSDILNMVGHNVARAA